MRSLAETVGGERVVVTNQPPNVDNTLRISGKPQDVVRLKDARVARSGSISDLWFDRFAEPGRATTDRARSLAAAGRAAAVDAQAIATRA